MHIQIVGASVNAVAMVYHLSEVGHQVYWLIGDEQLQSLVAQQATIFNDQTLSRQIYQHIANKQLSILQNVKGKSPEICVYALTSQQFDEFRENGIQEEIDHSQLVINYSHLEMGTTEIFQQVTGAKQIVYIPDFLQEGNVINSFLTRSLIVGCESDETVKRLVQEVFRPIFPLPTQYNFMSIRAAEFTKLSISGFLATKVSFMNDLSNAAEALGVDIEEVRIAMSTDTRIGEQYLYPGCGFGGGNLTRDILTLKEVVQSTGNVNGLLNKIWDINEYQKEIIFRKLWKQFDCQLSDKVIGFWGAAFKPNTNSLAQAPILNILEACWAQGAVAKVHDPSALENLKALYPDQELLILCDEPYDATQGADALCLITEWKQYWSPDFLRLKQNMRQHNLIDGRNIYNPHFVREQGFRYIGIGR
ncbi:nucleotide sugar dehydrogenase [Acinetobacter sp. A3.8]|uniref:UDP-glucose 6-dehydrogenase n=1 Tax=Acinetobacter sedimenti TaxID=2919922 RepID=A0A9X1WV78_9GAMM|nr:nucleotide sugar dehydrogenase [Acinetobacter sedimenti]MCJ8145819.1 nucleotide sugar dehydrogenase [Acinetobacter sedimenti]